MSEWASDEIERLRAEAKRLRELVAEWKAMAEAAQGDLERVTVERDEARRLAGAAKRQLDQQSEHVNGDWACVECRPESDCLREGFRCVRHSIPAEWVKP